MTFVGQVNRHRNKDARERLRIHGCRFVILISFVLVICEDACSLGFIMWTTCLILLICSERAAVAHPIRPPGLPGKGSLEPEASTVWSVEQMQRTTDNMAAAGRQAWRATRWTTKRALKTPGNLINHLVHGRRGPGHTSDDEFYSDDEEGRSENTRALLDVRYA